MFAVLIFVLVLEKLWQFSMAYSNSVVPDTWGESFIPVTSKFDEKTSHKLKLSVAYAIPQKLLQVFSF